MCDVYASVDYGLGRGVWPKEKVPKRKPHPHCLCYLIPITERKWMKVKEEKKLDKRILRRIAPQYVKDLEALGIDVEKLWSDELSAFIRKKDLEKIIGKENFKVLQSIGRTARSGKWKEANVKDIERELRALRRKYGTIPDEALQILKSDKVSSLELHYVKRKYYDGWNIKDPEELDRLFTQHIKNPEVLIYRQGDRLALELGRYVAVIHPPDTKITIFELEEQYEDYEDYARQTGRPIIRLWQLRHILSRLL